MFGPLQKKEKTEVRDDSGKAYKFSRVKRISRRLFIMTLKQDLRRLSVHRNNNLVKMSHLRKMANTREMNKFLTVTLSPTVNHVKGSESR